MERNFTSPELLRYAKDLRDNELKLFDTVSQNFASARQRCVAAVQTMEDQGTYGPIKEQYLRLHQMPLFAYGDALERLQGVQDDLMDEIVAIELIMFCGGPNRRRRWQEEFMSVTATVAAEARQTTSPSFLTEASISDHSEILQQLSPHRSHAAKSSTSSSMSKERGMGSEMSPLRKAMGSMSLSIEGDDDDDDDGEGGGVKGGPPLMMETASVYPSQELVSRPSMSPPRGATESHTPWQSSPQSGNNNDNNKGGDQPITPKGEPSSVDSGGEWKTVVASGAAKATAPAAASALSATQTSGKKGTEQQRQQQQQQQQPKGRYGPWDASTSSSESGG